MNGTSAAAGARNRTDTALASRSRPDGRSAHGWLRSALVPGYTSHRGRRRDPQLQGCSRSIPVHGCAEWPLAECAISDILARSNLVSPIFNSQTLRWAATAASPFRREPVAGLPTGMRCWNIRASGSRLTGRRSGTISALRWRRWVGARRGQRDWKGPLSFRKLNANGRKLFANGH